MGRIRWINVSLATVGVVVVVYAGLVLGGIARGPELFGTDDSLDQLHAVANTLPTRVAAAQVSAPQVASVQAVGGQVAAPQATVPAPAAPVVMPTAMPAPQPTVVPDEGFASEVPVPQSTGTFPLGSLTIAFDKEFPPYSPVVMLYQEKLAEKRGLGVHFVPFDIEDKNRISEFRRADLLRSGGFDILLTTMNSYALWGGPEVGRVTAIIGESAGADKAVVQSDSIKTFNDLYGKAVAYSDSSVSEYLLYFMLRAGGVPAQAVIRLGHENLNQSVRRYTDQQAHAVVGWTSSDLDTALKRSGSKVLMTSDQFRVTTDVIVTGSRALQARPAAVQAFHDAWFEASKLVFEHPDQAAGSMSNWSGSWTGVASRQDLDDALAEFAQATLADNRVVMSAENLPVMQARYKDAQAVWLWGGREVHQLVRDADLPTVFDATFVRKSAQDKTLVSSTPPVNPTFHLTARPDVKGLSADEQKRLQTVAVLDLKQVQFEQVTAELSAGARKEIEASVVPVLRNTVGTYLKIEGSAAWPEKQNLNETLVNSLAFERARAVQDYVIKFGIPVERLIVGTSLPRCRECNDATQVQHDNQVVFSLTTP